MKKEFEKEQKDNPVDDIFLDMDDDEKFSQWLEEEYQKEADTIEEALLAGRKYEDNQDIAEKLSVSREDFYRRAQKEGILKEEPAEKKILEFRKNTEKSATEKAVVEEKAAPDAADSSGKKKHSYVRWGRIAGIAGVCLICVFAASMSSEANRKYLVNSVRILSGNDSQLISYNDETNEDASTEESDAIADIEEKLGVKMPEFYYRPYGMEFSKYVVNEAASVAYIRYSYEGNEIFFYIDKQQENRTSNISSLNGEEKIISKIPLEDVEVLIKEIQDSQDKRLTYVADWKYEDVAYHILGKIKLKELEKMIKEMKI